jgi:hypothetical protein
MQPVMIFVNLVKPNKTNALYASFLLSKVHEQVKRST